MYDFFIELFQHIHWSILLLGIIAVLVASVIQGATGLGFGMVAGPILLLIDPIFVPGPMLFLAMSISLLGLMRDWQHVDFKGLSISLSGRIAGTILAAITFSLIPITLYGIIFGILVMIAVILTSTKLRVYPTSANLLSAGFASGFMGTLTAIGAPPMAIVYQHGEPSQVRSTLLAFFLIGSIFSLTALFYMGDLTVNHLLLGAIFSPVIFIGFRISSIVVPLMNASVVRSLMLAISGLSAFILILKSGYNLFNL